MRDLKTKEGRLYAARLIISGLRILKHGDEQVYMDEGEGQGEVSFGGVSILGMDPGGFSLSYAMEVPGTRWDPPTADVVEVKVYDHLIDAIQAALLLYLEQRVVSILECEQLGEEEEHGDEAHLKNKW